MAFSRKSRSLSAPPLTPDQALEKLEHFCAYRERCPQEVRDKMRELRLSEEMSEQLFQVLQEERFFEEERFTESFVRSKFRGNHWGKVRLRMELKMRRIDPEIMEQALANIDEEAYLELIQELLTKKIRQWADDPQGRQKAAAAVIRAGFEPDLVFQELNRQKRQ